MSVSTERNATGMRAAPAAIAVGASLALGLVCLSGCGGGGGGGPTNPGNVAGVVRDLDTQFGIAGALVDVAGAQDVTGANGEYAISNVPLGAQPITITKPAYNAFAGTVEVTEDTAFDAYLISTQAPPGAPAVISGTVSLSGAPAAVTVEAVDQATQVTEDAVTLPGPGDYGLWAPGEATYTVRASAPGYQPEERTVDLPNLGDTATGIDFALSP